MILIRSVGSLEGAADVLQTAIWLMRENLTSVKTGAAHLRFEACDRINHIELRCVVVGMPATHRILEGLRLATGPP